MPPLSLLSALVLSIAALLLAVHRPVRPRFLSEPAVSIAFALAVAGLVQTVFWGPVTLSVGAQWWALVWRTDLIGGSISVVACFVGWIVVRYTATYLRGEPRELQFTALILATLATVLSLLHAGNLTVLVMSFVLTGWGGRQLLLFYGEREEARRAAAKFTLVWAVGDVCILIASMLLAGGYGTSDLAAIGRAAGTASPTSAQVAIALLVVAAALKTASFPLHGWLTEVMEAPTPVSALLHAGIVNAGGFLLIRMAELVQSSSGAQAALVTIGGLSALFGASVMLTQSAVKTALAWSTVAQMGFLLLQCGLGLWPLAMLHIVAHSLYKAHAFLSAGGAVAAVQGVHRPGPVAAPSLAAVGRAFAIALAIYAAVAVVFGLFVHKSPQAVALGAILIFGVAYLLAQGLSDAAPRRLAYRTGVLSLGAATAYFAFHAIAEALWSNVLPKAPSPDALQWVLMVGALLSFGFVAFAQALFPLWAGHPAAIGLRVHLANGLYLNAVLDRVIGGFRTSTTHQDLS